MKQLHPYRFSERGEIAKIVIILVVIVLILGIGIYTAIRFISARKNNTSANQNTSTQNQKPEPPKPVYNVTLGDTKFILLSALDLGNTIKSNNNYDQDTTTTEKFIRVVIGAQNKGKNNLNKSSWDIGNIIDSEGRNFVTINDKVYSQIPKPDLCGALLKPEFDPIPCVKYYEVSKKSKGLKIMVKTTDPKKQDALLDLTITP